MIELEKSEARKLLVKKIEDEDKLVGNEDEASIGQLITYANHAIDPDRMVPWCPYCDRERDFCICDDEEAKKKERDRQMMSEEDKEEMREKVLEILNRRLDKEQIEKLEERSEKEEMEWCPLCYQSRFKELLYKTKNWSGDDTIIGCKHCLGEEK